MARPYEFIRADQDGFTGTTFGCSCCSQSDELRTDRKIRDALLDTANMYLRLADEYAEMRFAVGRYGGEAICEALGKYRALKRNRGAYRAALEYLAGRDAGEFGRQSAAIGLDTLMYRVYVAQAAISACEAEIIRIFCKEAVDG